ncbi:adenylate/guanylate cyclase domain-containing protein [Bradyrhizobium sp. B117]|uniref:adenylate/guanylate cyclase domain-containing protein n=1 Tax=Bradyrhizobium sp. B117 TaxID=3140246 RepID=UPI0031840966
MPGKRIERRLAAVVAADVEGYSRLMSADEVGTLAVLKSLRREVVDPIIAAHYGRIVKTTGDGMLIEFASAVDAVTCALVLQDQMRAGSGRTEPKITFRIGINVGDIIVQGSDIFGDGVNVAARVENECEPGGVCLSGSAFEQVRGKTRLAFYDLGERSLRNIDRPVRLYGTRPAGLISAASAPIAEATKPLPPPGGPSIAVLPFRNMCADPEQDYFSDGIAEDIITALSHFEWLFVIARNSSFNYKNKAVDIKQIGRELGVRYVLEGSVRRAGERIRVTVRLVETATGAHLWADKIDGAPDDVFALQDEVTLRVVGAIEVSITQAEISRAPVKPSSSGHVRSGVGALDSAIDHSLRSITLSPLDLQLGFAHGGLAYAYIAKGKYEEALEYARRAAHEMPRWVFGWAAMAIATAYLGDFEAARNATQRLQQLSPSFSIGAWDGAKAGREQWIYEKFYHGLRLAGVPENL